MEVDRLDVEDVDVDGEQQIVRWVDELARGFGLSAHHVDSLLAGVRRTLSHAVTEGTSFDEVKVVREPDLLEFQLGGTGGQHSFILYR